MDSLATSLKKEPIQAMIEYEYGYMKVGMGAAYTIRCLTNEFWALTQNPWEIYPTIGYRRLIDGSVVHKVTNDLRESQEVLAHEEMIVPPAKVVEERGRGTEIHSLADQGKLLQYWAWSQQPIEVGVFFQETNYMIEYRMLITLKPVPGDEGPLIYHRVLKEIRSKNELPVQQFESLVCTERLNSSRIEQAISRRTNTERQMVFLHRSHGIFDSINAR
jgi:hypothetical protein